MSEDGLSVSGWQLVPVEPTEKMVGAGIHAATLERDHLAQEGVPEIYRAMLFAAPMTIEDQWYETALKQHAAMTAREVAFFAELRKRKVGRFSLTALRERASRCEGEVSTYLSEVADEIETLRTTIRDQEREIFGLKFGRHASDPRMGPRST